MQFRLVADQQGLRFRDVVGIGPRGGRASGQVSLLTDGVGVTLEGNVATRGALIGEAAAAGRFDLAANFKGRGLSPRAIVTVLTGSGEIKLGETTVPGIDPRAVSEVATTFIVNGDLSTDALPEALRFALSDRGVGFAARTVPLTIKDGALEIAPVVQRTPDGRVENRTTVDLTRLAFDTAWRVLPASRRNAGRALPGITLIRTGPLSDLAAAVTRLDTDALAREIVVRRLESNVAELERLRREDEERARREAERRARRGLAPEPYTDDDGAAANDNGGAQSAAPGAVPPPRPAVPPNANGAGATGAQGVPRLVAPPVLRVPLPLPSVPGQRSQLRLHTAPKLARRPVSRPAAPAPTRSDRRAVRGEENRRRLAQATRIEEEMRRRFGLMRLGTPTGPYDPAQKKTGRNVSPEVWQKRSGIVDRSKVVAPTPRLILPNGRRAQAPTIVGGRATNNGIAGFGNGSSPRSAAAAPWQSRQLGGVTGRGVSPGAGPADQGVALAPQRRGTVPRRNSNLGRNRSRLRPAPAPRPRARPRVRANNDWRRKALKLFD